SADEFKQLSDIERLIKALLPRKVVDGFDPVNTLPESRLNTRPARSNKPKKPKPGHRDGQRSGNNAQGNRAGNNSGNRSGNRSGNNSGNRSGNR
ncbi:MAG: ATP-dependent helicase, partial [Proteobacteria bacterium]|nr:ATP-dependent helicase [Pseudomonadota bacterium]